MLGLWNAARRFEPARWYAFSTYAADTIRGHVLHHFKARRMQNRLPCVSLEVLLAGDGGELADMIADPLAEVPRWTGPGLRHGCQSCRCVSRTFCGACTGRRRVCRRSALRWAPRSSGPGSSTWRLWTR